MNASEPRDSHADVEGLSLRPRFQVTYASALAAVAAGSGSWLVWSERHDLGVVVLLGGMTAASVVLLARLASCRVWTTAGTLRVRNTLRTYRFEASEISGFAAGRTRDSEMLGAEGPLVLTDDGRRILLQGASRPYPTWFAAGTDSEHDRMRRLTEWHRRCRWSL